MTPASLRQAQGSARRALALLLVAGVPLPAAAQSVTQELKKLYGYLADRGSFVALDNFNPEYLSIFSRDVLKKIAAGDASWKDDVPTGVSDMIVKRRFFGCKG